ncbi:cytochrome c1-2, heme protein, mitochondrial [Tanacetum coccineum]
MPPYVCLISYHDLVGVAYIDEETKAMAAEIEVVDGPNDEGQMFTRPRKLSDRFPQPYPTEQAARTIDNACEPVDVQQVFEMNLSCLLKEQLLEPALNLTVHCCGLEFRVLNGYDQKSFDEERGLN